MNELDQQVLEQSIQLLKQGKTLYLCSILSTYGSAPRPVGSLFATDGYLRLGSISGGCVEDAFIQLIQQNQLTNSQCVFDYGTHIAPDHTKYELPCGGHIQLLVEKINGDNIPELQQWLKQAQQNQDFFRCVNLKTAERQIYLQAPFHLDPNWVLQSYEQKYQLLLIGISQVSEQLARLAAKANFTVRLCDMREEYAPHWHWPASNDGIDIIWQGPDIFVEKYVTAKTAVLALAHDPRVDDLAMMAALESNAFYIGALGSSRTSAKRRERLKRIGEYSEEELNRLHAPIGLPIGSRTPFEIAIAILADLIAAKNDIHLIME